MGRIIIIGTLHAGMTSEKELKVILEKYNPYQILVEISQKDINNGAIDSYPSEMIFAYRWAKNRGKKINGFDAKINTLKAEMTEEDNQKVIEEQKKIMENFSWKDMNKPENLQMLDTDSEKNLIDLDKEIKRESEMLRNIRNVIVKKGIVLILTGCGHLDFFEKNIKDAIFPFR